MLREDVFKVDVLREYLKEGDPFTLGVVFIEMGLLQYASEELRNAKKNSLDPVKARELLGLLYLEMGKPEKAIEEFKDAIDMVEDFSRISARLYYNLASVYEKVGEPDKALVAYEEAYIRDIYYKDIEMNMARLRQQKSK